MKQVALIDYCLPDYFSGYSKPVVNVSVYSNMSHEEVGEAIEAEINYLFDHLSQGYSEEEMKLWDKFIQELKDKGDEPYVTGVEPPEEDDDEYECAYLYFAIIDPVYQHGIMFLN